MKRQVTSPLKGKISEWCNIYNIYNTWDLHIYEARTERMPFSWTEIISSNQRPFLVQFARKTEQDPSHCLDFRLDFMLFLFYSNETVISDAVCLQNRPHGPNFRPVYICIMTSALLNNGKLFNCFQRNALSSNESKGICAHSQFTCSCFSRKAQ